MFLHKTKAWWSCAIARAERTVAQTLVGMIPVGLVITPTLLQELDKSLIYVVVAWLLTGVFSGFTSLLTSYAKGIPEVDGDNA